MPAGTPMPFALRMSELVSFRCARSFKMHANQGGRARFADSECPTPLTSNATLAYAPHDDGASTPTTTIWPGWRRHSDEHGQYQARGARWTAMPSPSTEVGRIWRAFVVLRATMAGSGPPFCSLAWPKGAGRGRKHRGARRLGRANSEEARASRQIGSIECRQRIGLANAPPVRRRAALQRAPSS